MSMVLLKLNVWVRYINVLTVLVMLSNVPLPISRVVLLSCCLFVLGVNFIVHLYVLATKRYLLAAYLLLALDLLTVIPAIYFSGFVASPFFMILPLTLYSVYFVEYDTRRTILYGATCISSLAFLFVIWWFFGPPVTGWDPRDFPVFTLFLVVLQLAVLSTVIYQSRQLPNSLIQELHKQEATLLRQQHRAELGASLSIISHEIRNPLTTVSLSVEYAKGMIRRMIGPEKQKVLKHLKTSEQELNRIGEMLESVLSYAREKRGQYHFARHDIKAMILRATDFVKLKYGRHQVTFQVDCGPMDDQVLLCDRDAMHQVLVNLLDNAIQHRDEQRPLRLEFRVMKKEDHISLTLRDNGKGIPSDKLSRIFERFVTGRAGGTGIGLSIVQQIIKDHLGDIKVHSIEGAGTTFILSMPISPALPAATAHEPAEAIKPATSATKPISDTARA